MGRRRPVFALPASMRESGLHKLSHQEKGKQTIVSHIKISPEADAVLSLVKTSLDDDKALDIVVIPLAGKTSIADYMVIASGTSQRHISAMAERLKENIKASGVDGVAIEGAGVSDWVLIDGGDVIIHLFRPEVRAFYGLEKMWGMGDVEGSRDAGTPKQTHVQA